MLTERSLNSLVSIEDVAKAFAVYERTFRRYIDDPLWPTFKFPWTSNEQARLVGRVRLRIMQMKPTLDDVALKAQHGGASAELKERAVHEILRTAQQLLSEAAFLRKPPYPGVSCRYRGQCGFTAVIRGSFYEQGKRAREEFRAMKYFHLGHRLEGIVEQELATHAKQQELDQ